MKQYLFIILIMILMLSCSKLSNKTINLNDQNIEREYLTLVDSDNYDLMINFKYSRNNQNNILVNSTGSIPISTFTLKINNDNVELKRFADIFDGKYDFVEGKTYNIEINLNGSTYKTKLNMPYKISISTYPPSFDRNENYTLNWEIKNNNQIQRVLLQGFSKLNEVKYPRYLDPKARTFTFEKNTTNLDELITTAIIENINYSIEDKILFYAYVESYLNIAAQTIYNE